MKRLFLASICISALLCLIFAGISFWRFNAPVHLLEPVTIIIEKGTGKKAVLKQLHKSKISPPWWQVSLPMILSGHHNLKAGEYLFETSVTPAEALDKIARGEVVVHKITLPEGWNILQIEAALLAETKLTGELPPLKEGAYLPETYHFSRGEARSEVLSRMKHAMDDVLNTAWNQRAQDIPVHSKEDLLVLASIVERETGIASERPLVASVYANRLRKNMPLQADPTVAYGIEITQKRPMERALTRKDLERDHAWNTYTRAGLPATPIACAGKASIMAAATPPASDFLYFVADGKGGHVFSSTLSDHNRNVAAYRTLLRSR